GPVRPGGQLDAERGRHPGEPGPAGEVQALADAGPGDRPRHRHGGRHVLPAQRPAVDGAYEGLRVRRVPLVARAARQGRAVLAVGHDADVREDGRRGIPPDAVIAWSKARLRFSGARLLRIRTFIRTCDAARYLWARG